MLDLPSEVLIDICESIEAADLPNVRLTCKQLRDTATQHFGKVNFTETVHVVTPYSMDTLMKITEHPVFGQCIESIGICSARRTVPIKGPPRQSQILNGYVTSNRFGRQMERVFRIIKRLSGSVAITVYDNPGVGSLGYLPGYRLCSTLRTTPIKCRGWLNLLKLSASHITYRTAETLEQTVYAARRASCRLTHLKMDLFAPYNPWAQLQIQQSMWQILQSSLRPLSVELDRSRTPQLSYNSTSESVEICDIMLGGNTMGAGFNTPVDASYAWLGTQPVTSLKVELFDNYTPGCLQAVLAPPLKHLDLSRMHAHTGHLSHNLWSDTISAISRLPNLEYCRLSEITYGIDFTWGNDQMRYLDYPGVGRIPCDYSGFKLRFFDGEGSIELSGEDIQDKLLDLAHYVRAAEDHKRQKIVHDGVVQDEIVRGVQKVEN